MARSELLKTVATIATIASFVASGIGDRSLEPRPLAPARGADLSLNFRKKGEEAPQGRNRGTKKVGVVLALNPSL